MVSIKNTTSGPKGVWTKTGHVLVQPGESGDYEMEDGEIASARAAGHFEISGAEQPSQPALTGKNKAQLLEIATAEGVEVADDATNAQIVDAIEAKRASNN